MFDMAVAQHSLAGDGWRWAVLQLHSAVNCSGRHRRSWIAGHRVLLGVNGF